MSAAARSAPNVPAPGTLVGGKYLVGETLASGGMGCLVRAHHQLLDREVALKFVLGQGSRSAKARMLREARALRALTSDYVVRVFDLGVYEDAPYIVMELLSGVDLDAYVDDKGPLPVEEAVDCVIEAASAIAEAHAVGIVHRDVKPANLFFARTRGRGLVKVLDFGISKVPLPERNDDLEETSEDAVLGTPHFMSPEQLRNPAKVDARTDVWALGVTLFYLLSGKLCFEGTTRREIMGAIFADEPRDLRALRPDAPEGLVEVIARALAKRPDHRTPTVAALVEGLIPFASGRGRIAAEQMPDASAPEPAVAVARASGSAASRLTDSGMSSTLSPSAHESAAPRTKDSPTRNDATPSRRVPVLVAVGALLALSAAWVATRPASVPSGSVESASSSGVVSAAGLATSSASVATIAASASASAEPRLPTASSAQLPPSPPSTPMKSTSPASAKPMAPEPAAPEPAIDADGIPILE